MSVHHFSCICLGIARIWREECCRLGRGPIWRNRGEEAFFVEERESVYIERGIVYQRLRLSKSSLTASSSSEHKTKSMNKVVLISQSPKMPSGLFPSFKKIGPPTNYMCVTSPPASSLIPSSPHPAHQYRQKLPPNIAFLKSASYKDCLGIRRMTSFPCSQL